jgi:phage terminase large subunit
MDSTSRLPAMQKISQDEVDFIAFHARWNGLQGIAKGIRGGLFTYTAASVKIGKKRQKNRQSLAVSGL